jgi:subtilisin family serine protease
MKAVVAYLMGLSLLAGCSTMSEQTPEATIEAKALERSAVAPPPISWGERVVVTNNTVTQARVTYLGEETLLSVTRRSQGQLIFDIPGQDNDPPVGIREASITPREYAVKPNGAAYERRGSVQFLNAAGQTVYQIHPFGTIDSQVNILAGFNGDCAVLFDQLTYSDANGNKKSLLKLLTNAYALTETSNLCLLTTINLENATKVFIDNLEQQLEVHPGISNFGFAVEPSTAFSLNSSLGGIYSYDPSCAEIRNVMDPIINPTYNLLYSNRLLFEIGSSATALTGAGVDVILIGGGIGAADQFNCNPYSFSKHDTHIADVIAAIADQASVSGVSVCTPQGVCTSSNIVRALFDILKRPSNKPTIINMSLGGPLPSPLMFRVLELLGSRKRIPVIVSGGNNPQAVNQYPASYSVGVATFGQPALKNVISVAALGLRNQAHEIAAFNTHGNADFFAFGVNLCPGSAIGAGRCAINAQTPNKYGISGSSFAAPVLTGLVALYAQAAGDIPRDLRTCIQSQLRNDAVTQVKYVALNEALLTSPPCQR